MIDGEGEGATGAEGGAGAGGAGAGAAGGAQGGDGGAGGDAGKAKEPEKSPFQSKLDKLRSGASLEEIRESGTGATDGAEAEEEVDDDADGGEAGDEPLTRESDGATWIEAEDGQSGHWEVDGEEVDGEAPEEWAPRAPDDTRRRPTTGAKGKDGKDGAGKAAKPLVFKLPGRNDGDKDLEVPLDRAALEKLKLDPDEVQERLAQMRNGYGRKTALEKERREFQAREAQFDETMAEVAEDPRSYMLDHVKPENHKDIVLDLLSRMKDETYDEVAALFDEWQEDPSKRRTAAADAREKASERKETRATAKAASKARTDYTNALHEQVTGLVPEDWQDEQANEFYDFAGLALQRWGSQQPKGTRLDPKDAPALLAKLGVLKRFDLTLPDGDADDAARGKRHGAAKPTSRTPGKKPSVQDREARARQTGKDLQDRHDRRREATATPAGAGAAAASTGFPKGQKFSDRMKALRKKIGI